MFFKNRKPFVVEVNGIEQQSTEGEIVVREVKAPKRDILNTAWKAITEHAFPITGPNDGRPLSVVRVDDIYEVLNRQLGENEQKLDIY